MNKKITPKYKTKVLTGIRATGGLTIGNVLGAVMPVIHLGELTGMKPLVFVADLHALTDHEPNIVKKNIFEVVTDYLALGLDPDKIDIFIQSDIKAEVFELTALLARHITVAELIRVPTLKEKIRSEMSPETANALLVLYPIMMAADILLQRAEFVPVGEDQQPHIEMTRLLAKRFNKRYGNVFPLPKPQEVRQLRIISLNGQGKMSKSTPEGAIFLDDDESTIRAKVKRAQTAFDGQMPEILVSHFDIARGFAKNDEVLKQVEEIYESHMHGNKVMGEFKSLLADIIVDYVMDYQEKKKAVLTDRKLVDGVLEKGLDLAKKNASETMELVRGVMG